MRAVVFVIKVKQAKFHIAMVPSCAFYLKAVIVLRYCGEFLLSRLGIAVFLNKYGVALTSININVMVVHAI